MAPSARLCSGDAQCESVASCWQSKQDPAQSKGRRNRGHRRLCTRQILRLNRRNWQSRSLHAPAFGNEGWAPWLGRPARQENRATHESQSLWARGPEIRRALAKSWSCYLVRSITDSIKLLRMASDLFLLLQQLPGAAIRPPSRLLALKRKSEDAAAASMQPGQRAEAIPAGHRFPQPQTGQL